MPTFSRYGCAALVIVAASTLATTARAQSADGLTRLRDTLKREPKAPDVVKMALDYYRVSPEAMESVRSSARVRALMPVVSGFISYANQGGAQATNQTISNPTVINVNTAQNVTSFTAGLGWDFREL